MNEPHENITVEECTECWRAWTVEQRAEACRLICAAVWDQWPDGARLFGGRAAFKSLVVDIMHDGLRKHVTDWSHDDDALVSAFRSAFEIAEG